MNQSNSEDGWWRFLQMCTEIESPEQFDQLFNLFLTIDEKNDLAHRYLIVRDLLQGERTQREMAENLQVSIAKITRGSNSLKTIGEDLRHFLIEHIK